MLANKKVLKKCIVLLGKRSGSDSKRKPDRRTRTAFKSTGNINPLLPLVKLWTTQKVPSQWVYNFAKLTSNWSYYQN